MLQIVEAKIQTYWQKNQYISKRSGEVKESLKPIKVGTYIELNDGNVYEIDGQTYRGPGTRIRFNFKHRTISVQTPNVIKTGTIGYLTDSQKQPIWEDGEKISGYTTKQFESTYGKTLVALAYIGHDQAMLELASAA